ncbi:sensor domain-containing protein [Mycobacterium colombiense]
MLATLSVVFAFVFAPAGLILGHLALAQIRRSGERGRDRALVGVTLSYVFITAAVIALIVAAVMPDTTPARVAAPATITTTTSTSTPTTPPPPPPPTVAPADLDGLLPSLEDVEGITTDQGMKIERTLHQPTPDPVRGKMDRPDCWPVIESSAPEAYDGSGFTGFSATEILDKSLNSQWSTGQGATAFHDAAAAQAMLQRLLSTFRQCGGSTLNATWPNGKTYPVSIRPPADAGNGTTAIDVVPQTPISILCVHAVAAKANVVVDVQTCTSGKTDATRQATLAITNLILGRIPG